MVFSLVEFKLNNKILVVTLLALLGDTARAHDPKGFDDTVLHTIAWHGKDDLLVGFVIDVTIPNKK